MILNLWLPERLDIQAISNHHPALQTMTPLQISRMTIKLSVYNGMWFENIGDAFAVFMTAEFDSARLQKDQSIAWKRQGVVGIRDVMTRLRAYDPLTFDAYKLKAPFHEEVIATAEPLYKHEMTKFCVGKPSKEGWKSAPLYLKCDDISEEVLTKNNFDAIQQEFSKRV